MYIISEFMYISVNKYSFLGFYSFAVMKLIVFTMFFSGGTIPTFILVFKFGIIDTVWAMVLPHAVSAWNIIIFPLAHS